MIYILYAYGKLVVFRRIPRKQYGHASVPVSTEFICDYLRLDYLWFSFVSFVVQLLILSAFICVYPVPMSVFRACRRPLIIRSWQMSLERDLSAVALVSYSGFTPEALTTTPHFLISSRSRFPNASGDVGIDCRPCASNCSLTAAEFRIVVVSWLSLTTTDRGAPAVTHRPYQPLLS